MAAQKHGLKGDGQHAQTAQKSGTRPGTSRAGTAQESISVAAPAAVTSRGEQLAKSSKLPVPGSTGRRKAMHPAAAKQARPEAASFAATANLIPGHRSAEEHQTAAPSSGVRPTDALEHASGKSSSPDDDVPSRKRSKPSPEQAHQRPSEDAGQRSPKRSRPSRHGFQASQMHGMHSRGMSQSFTDQSSEAEDKQQQAAKRRRQNTQVVTVSESDDEGIAAGDTARAERLHQLGAANKNQIVEHF